MSYNVPVPGTNVLIHIRHEFNFMYFKCPYYFLLGKSAKLFETTHLYWAPSLHLENENYNSCKSSKKRYERSVKRKILADTNSPPNNPLKNKS